MEYEIELYEKSNKVPVLDFILSLNAKQQAKIYREIELLKKFGNELSFPHVRKIEGEKYNALWELRIKFASDAYRIFYFVYCRNQCVLLHGFKKKTEKTPEKELETAINRMNDYLEKNKNEVGSSKKNHSEK
jgi:phage-related protein